MFDPKSSKDRVNYGDALIPPIGFFLERAVVICFLLPWEMLSTQTA